MEDFCLFLEWDKTEDNSGDIWSPDKRHAGDKI